MLSKEAPVTNNAHLDAQDQTALVIKQMLLEKVATPRVGDYVEFTDGTVRRISHLWDNGCQTSDAGSFYLGAGWVSFSGSLFHQVRYDTLTLTNEVRPGHVWFFHHDFMRAGNGVPATLPFRVYTYTLLATS